MNEGSFIPVSYLTPAERYLSSRAYFRGREKTQVPAWNFALLNAPFEPQANGQDVKGSVDPLHLSCPPFQPARYVLRPNHAPLLNQASRVV